MRTPVLSVLVASTLFLSACGSDGGDITVSKSSSGDFDTALCAEFESEDGPSDELLAGLPAEYAATAGSIVEFGEALDAMGDNDDTSLDQLSDALTKDGLGDDLRAFAAFAEKECGESDGATQIAQMAVAADMASAEQVDEYCTALADGFSDDNEGGPEQLAALMDIAPEAHREGLDALSKLDASTATDADMGALFGPLFGLGIYAEKVCGIDGAAAQMLLGAMFIGMGDDMSSGTDDGSDDSATDDSGVGVDPAQFPDITADSANAALPAGSAITFQVVSADLEDDGEYLASMVVPEGWDMDQGFNVEFSPPADSGASIFTSMEAGAGCDGTCAATDWDARLREEVGAISQFTTSHPSATEEPIAGSEGVVLTDTSDGATALVLRWDDSADKYFSCSVDLDEDDAALLPAFVEACVASRPAWFAVS